MRKTQDCVHRTGDLKSTEKCTEDFLLLYISAAKISVLFMDDVYLSANENVVRSCRKARCRKQWEYSEVVFGDRQMDRCT